MHGPYSCGALDRSPLCMRSHARKFGFEIFKDMRQRPELIAENREDATPRLVTTKGDVGVFVSTRMRQIFDRGSDDRR